jgi:hypothetical protein
LVLSCDRDERSSDLHFHGETELLPGFRGDTGLKPPSSDVQVQFVVTASGTLTADGDADGDAALVVGRSGSGRLAIAGKFQLEGHLKIQISGLPKYDGPIPKLDQVDLSFGGESSFDPFLLAGASASVSAELPETKLPDIPLPGGLTGKLVVTIAKGSTVSSAVTGTCAGIDDGKVTWRAKATTTGKLILKPTIVVKIPIKGDKSFDLPAIPVDIPARDAALDLGTHDVGDGAAPNAGTPSTSALPGGCGGGSTNDSGSPIDDASSSDGGSSETDVEPTAGDHEVTCGGSGCDVRSDYCCVSDAGELCLDGGFPCDGSKLRCDQTGDCATGVCCVVPDPVTFTVEASCKASCGGTYERKACASDAECGPERCITEGCRGRTISLCGGLPPEVKAACE